MLDCFSDIENVLPGQIWGPRRMKPNEHTYRLITRICREAGLLTEALHAYRGMRRSTL